VDEERMTREVRSMKRLLVLFFTVPLMLGCASAERWVRENPRTVIGIGAGALTGGMIGGIVGYQTGSTAAGALIGSAIGGTTGGLWGHTVECLPDTSGGPHRLSGYNPAVADAQRDLQLLGYKTGPVDGVMGPKTERALREFQADYNLSAKGNLDNPTALKIKQVLGTRNAGDRSTL
jgi:hypothetical protein